MKCPLHSAAAQNVLNNRKLHWNKIEWAPKSVCVVSHGILYSMLMEITTEYGNNNNNNENCNQQRVDKYQSASLTVDSK